MALASSFLTAGLRSSNRCAVVGSRGQAQGQLGQVVGADGEAVEELEELFGQDGVGQQFAS